MAQLSAGRPVGIGPGQNMFETDATRRGIMEARGSFVKMLNLIFARTPVAIERPDAVEALNSEAPISEFLAWRRPVGTRHIEPVPPRSRSEADQKDALGNSVLDSDGKPFALFSEWDVMALDISERDALLVDLNFCRLLTIRHEAGRTVRVLVNAVETSTPQWSIWEAKIPDMDNPPHSSMGDTTLVNHVSAILPGNIFTVAKSYDKHVTTLAERNLLAQGATPIPVGSRVLVDGEPQTSGFWTVWRWEGNGLWKLVRMQTYRTADFWDRVDWYAEGYDAANPPVVRYATPKIRDEAEFDLTKVSQRSAKALATLDRPNPKTPFVRVDDDGTGKWIWTFYQDGAWNTVARQNGTIKFSEKLHDITRPRILFYDDLDDTKDEVGFVTEADLPNLPNREGSWELRKMVNTLRDANLLTDLEVNEVFFSMLHFVHAQQDQVDWAFKTSFLNVGGYNESLRPVPVQPVDNTQNLLDYIEEVKPYRVKTRDFTRVVTPDIDVANVYASDFDFPLYYDAAINQYRALDMGLDKETGLYDLERSKDIEIIRNESPWKEWYENYWRSGHDPENYEAGSWNPVRFMKVGMLFDRVDHMPTLAKQDSIFHWPPVQIETDTGSGGGSGGGGDTYIEIEVDGQPYTDYTIDGQSYVKNVVKPNDDNWGLLSSNYADFSIPQTYDPSFIVTIEGRRVFQSKPGVTSWLTNDGIFVPTPGRTYQIQYVVRKIKNTTNGLPAYFRPVFDYVDNSGWPTVAVGAQYGPGYETDPNNGIGQLNAETWPLNEWVTVGCKWTAPYGAARARGRLRVNRRSFDTPTGPFSDAVFQVSSGAVIELQNAGGEAVVIPVAKPGQTVTVLVKSSTTGEVVKTFTRSFERPATAEIDVGFEIDGRVVDVFVDGVQVKSDQITIDGSTVTLNFGPRHGALISIVVREGLSFDLAAERIQQFYDPTNQQAYEKNLRRLMGLEFEQNVFDGGTFANRELDYEVQLSPDATETIEAAKLADPQSGENRPQELVIAATSDAVEFKLSRNEGVTITGNAGVSAIVVNDVPVTNITYNGGAGGLVGAVSNAIVAFNNLCSSSTDPWLRSLFAARDNGSDIILVVGTKQGMDARDIRVTIDTISGDIIGTTDLSKETTWAISQAKPNHDLLTPKETGDYDAQPLDSILYDVGVTGGSEVFETPKHVGGSRQYMDAHPDDMTKKQFVLDDGEYQNADKRPSLYEGESLSVFVQRSDSWEFIKWQEPAGALAEPLTANSNTVVLTLDPSITTLEEVANSVITLPTKEAVIGKGKKKKIEPGKPGVAWINGERIEFMDVAIENGALVLRELKRGTHGTRVSTEQFVMSRQSANGVVKSFVLDGVPDATKVNVVVHEPLRTPQGIPIINENYSGYPVYVGKHQGLDYTIETTSTGVKVNFLKAPLGGTAVILSRTNEIAHPVGMAVYDGRSTFDVRPDRLKGARGKSGQVYY